MKRALSLILCVLLVIVSLVACGSTEDTSKEESKAESQSADTSAEASAEASEESSVDEFYDGLPEKDYGGKEFTILCRTEFAFEFDNDESKPEKVNTLILERNRAVEERFNVTIQTQQRKGSWGVHEDFMNYVRNSISGNEVDYDLIAGYAAIIPSVVGDDCFMNWHDFDEWINFEKSWWNQDIIDELTINGKLYLITGDISLALWDNVYCMFFNKDLAEDYGLTDLYAKASAGEWTFDYFYSICKDYYIPVDDESSKVYTYATQRTTQIDLYQDAFDIPVTQKDSDGKPVFTINQEKTYNALEMVYDLVVDQEYTKIINADDTDYYDIFGKGKTLFEPLPLGDGIKLQDYDNIKYGILPMPKYDSEQTTYYTSCKDDYSLFAVPVTCADNEFVGIITEALCVQSSKSVIPEYYNMILKYRNVNDEESLDMIELIREGVKCSFGYLYSYALDWPAHQFNVCINNENRSFASNWQSKESQFESNLEKVIEYYFDD